MRADVYWIPGPWPGRLGIVPRPRGGDWLADDVRSWKEAGFDVIASLLTPGEIAGLDLHDEDALSRAQGLDFHSFPIPDRGVPESWAAAKELLAELERALESGKNVALHCRQGIGRSSLVAASLLVAGGQEPEQAFQAITHVRGLPVPETQAQRSWVEDLSPAAPTVAARRGR
jgi:protein-tyrosine phosphatase